MKISLIQFSWLPECSSSKYKLTFGKINILFTSCLFKTSSCCQDSSFDLQRIRLNQLVLLFHVGIAEWFQIYIFDFCILWLLLKCFYNSVRIGSEERSNELKTVSIVYHQNTIGREFLNNNLTLFKVSINTTRLSTGIEATRKCSKIVKYCTINGKYCRIRLWSYYHLFCYCCSDNPSTFCDIEVQLKRYIH